MTEVAALIFSSLATVVVLFQCALALGAPWGAYAMGGIHPGKYPLKLRFAAFVQGLLMALTGLIILSKAGITSMIPTELAGVAIWLVIALMAFSFVLNLITKSTWERRIWAPLTLLLFISSIIVAIF